MLSITLKSWLSVQAAILLAATTRLPDLLVALRAFRVPRLLVAVIGLMWRYMFVVGGRSRPAAAGSSVAERRRSLERKKKRWFGPLARQSGGGHGGRAVPALD